MDRRTFLAGAAGLAVAGSVAGCSGTSASEDYDIGMTTRRFRPAEIEVEPGTTVVWRNTSSHAHTVTAYEEEIPDGTEYWASGGFDSEADARDAWRAESGGALYQGDTYSREFTEPGIHSYVCIPHEPGGMAGAVIVSGGESAGTNATSEPTQ